MLPKKGIIIPCCFCSPVARLTPRLIFSWRNPPGPDGAHEIAHRPFLRLTPRRECSHFVPDDSFDLGRRLAARVARDRAMSRYRPGTQEPPRPACRLLRGGDRARHENPGVDEGGGVSARSIGIPLKMSAMRLQAGQSDIHRTGKAGASAGGRVSTAGLLSSFLVRLGGRFFVPTAHALRRRAQAPSRLAVVVGDRPGSALPGHALMAASTASHSGDSGPWHRCGTRTRPLVPAPQFVISSPVFGTRSLGSNFLGAKTVPKKTAKHCKCLKLLGGGVAQLVRAAES